MTPTPPITNALFLGMTFPFLVGARHSSGARRWAASMAAQRRPSDQPGRPPLTLRAMRHWSGALRPLLRRLQRAEVPPQLGHHLLGEQRHRPLVHLRPVPVL